MLVPDFGLENVQRIGMAKELVYEYDGAKLYFNGTHYLTDSQEDYRKIVGHLQEIMHSNSVYSEDYKTAKWVFCDLFIKGCMGPALQGNSPSNI